MLVKINGKKYDFFNEVNVDLIFNSFASTFGFKALFDPDNPEHRSLFKPLRYSKVEVEHNGEILITGRRLTEKFRSTSVDELSNFSGYSLSGTFQDSNPTLDTFPLQSDGLSLKEIAEKLFKPFDIALVVDDAVKDKAEETFETTDAKADATIASYLTELASQKGIVISHTSSGAVYFTEAKTNQKPIADLSSALEKEISINGQGIHSSIAAFKEADIEGGNSGQEELDNPLVQSLRPKIIIQSSGDDVDTELVAKKARAAELKSIKLTVTVDTWTINDKIIKPNNIITVQDPRLYLFEKSNWFIEDVALRGNEKEQTATLNCVMPEVYNLKDPVSPFR